MTLVPSIAKKINCFITIVNRPNSFKHHHLLYNLNNVFRIVESSSGASLLKVCGKWVALRRGPWVFLEMCESLATLCRFDMKDVRVMWKEWIVSLFKRYFRFPFIEKSFGLESVKVFAWPHCQEKWSLNMSSYIERVVLVQFHIMSRRRALRIYMKWR